MARSQVSVTDPLREAMSLFDEAVVDIRNRGYTKENALARAATVFDLSLARAKRLLYGEAFSISPQERLNIRRRYLDHLDDEAAYHAERLEAAKARQRQMELGL